MWKAVKQKSKLLSAQKGKFDVLEKFCEAERSYLCHIRARKWKQKRQNVQNTSGVCIFLTGL